MKIYDISEIMDYDSIQRPKVLNKNNTNFFWKSISYLFKRIWLLLRLKLCCDIKPQYYNWVNWMHPIGIVFYPRSCGKNVTIYQNVTVASRKLNYDYPIIEDNVVLYSGSMILGNVIIGKNSIIGAGAIVLKDVSENSTIIGLWK